MQTSLSSATLQPVFERLQETNLALAARFAGDRGERQPVHVVYGGAHLFKADAPRKLGEIARRSLAESAPNFVVFARAMGLPGAERLPESQAEIDALIAQAGHDEASLSPEASLAHAVYARVGEKLTREPIEDLRIDFEDGYGTRPGAEEDAHAVAAARELAAAMQAGALPSFCGVRIKSLAEETRERAVRTLDLFLTTLCQETGGALPSGFVITLPKVTHTGQVTALVSLLEALESALSIAAGSLRLELMIETTQSVLTPSGLAAPGLLVEAAKGRCVAAHFGTYDYTASCNITAREQRHDHPAADFARHVMQVTLARTGVRLSDGATVTMPIGPHRAPKGAALTAEQQAENARVVHRAWRIHFENVTRSLVAGFYQSWDLHPAQLPARYAAVHAFFLGGVKEAAPRLRNFVDRAAQATLLGDVFDDAATGQGLLNYFLRAMSAGAMTEAQVSASTGLSAAELQTRSFAAIVAGRQQR